MRHDPNRSNLHADLLDPDFRIHRLEHYQDSAEPEVGRAKISSKNPLAPVRNPVLALHHRRIRGFPDMLESKWRALLVTTGRDHLQVVQETQAGLVLHDAVPYQFETPT